MGRWRVPYTVQPKKKKKAANSLPKINTNTYLTRYASTTKNRSNHTLITV